MIKAFRGTSLVDFPGRVASVVFTGGCNLRCPYCYNVDLVLPERLARLPDIPVSFVLDELSRRRGFVEAVVVTGGEPLIHGDALLELLDALRGTGLLVKLDTNGCFPDALSAALSLLDFVAIDVKTSPDRYPLLGGRWEPVEGSLRLLASWGGEYEVRITAVPGFVDADVLEELAPLLEGVPRVALQKFVNQHGTLDPSYSRVHPYTREEMEELASILAPHVGRVELR